MGETARGPVGVVYLVHFAEPYRHARHYKRQGGASRRCPICREERKEAVR